jgi:predicted ATP-grasp superfamily ATP-dependent carboligase
LLNETEIAGFRGVGVIHGKAIVYAHAPVMIQADQIAIWLQQAKDKGDIADIPAIAGVIPRGLPIVTLFAAGSTSEEVRTRLAAAVNLFEQSLHYTETVASFQHLSS